MQLPPETFTPRRCIKLARWQRLPVRKGRNASCQTARHVVQPGGERSQLADAIARAVYACDPALVLVGWQEAS